MRTAALLGTLRNARSQVELGMWRGRTWRGRAGQAFELGEPDVADGTTAEFIRCGRFWTRAWGQRELADERTDCLKSPARLQDLFTDGLDIPPTHVQFSSLHREHPIWMFDAPQRVTRWARANCSSC